MNLLAQIATVALCGVLLGCSNNGEPMSETQATVASAGETSAGPIAEIAAIEQAGSPERLVRVIVTVSGSPPPSDANLSRVSAALSAAGAATVEPIAGTPMLVVEATPAQLRAAANTGLIASVQLDSPSPPN
jgi:hypothetical protein